MKKIISSVVVLFLLLFLSLQIASKAEAVRRVKGYTTKKGTYVAPHFQSTPNRSKFDNFSTKGNSNPYTGKKGTVNPY